MRLFSLDSSTATFLRSNNLFTIEGEQTWQKADIRGGMPMGGGMNQMQMMKQAQKMQEEPA